MTEITDSSRFWGLVTAHKTGIVSEKSRKVWVMKKNVFAVFGIVALAACGGGDDGKGASCEITTTMQDGTQFVTCAEFPGFENDAIEKTCNAYHSVEGWSAEFLPGGCPTEGLVGKCRSIADDGPEMVTSYYEDTADVAKASCELGDNEWIEP